MKRITIKDVAKRAGVSIATVSQVLTGAPYARISLKTRKKVLKIVKKLDYSPNILARGLTIKRTSLIGVIIPDIVNSFFPHILQGVEDVLIKNNYSMILCTYDKDFKKEEECLDTLIKKQVDGIIWAPSKNINYLYKKYLPWRKKIILICYDNDKYFISLKPNNRLGGYLATEYLIKKGCSKILHLSSHMVDLAGEERYKGYKDALKKYKIKFDKNLVISVDYTFEFGYKSTKEAFEKGIIPEGIFACSDIVAIGSISFLKEKGYKIPEDIKIIGYDDIPVASLVEPKLTTIAQPKLEIGKKAAMAIFDMLENKVISSQELIPCLVERESA